MSMNIFAQGLRIHPLALAVSLCVASSALNAADLQLPSIDVQGQAAKAPLAAQGLQESKLKQRRSTSNDTAKLLRGVPGVAANGAGGLSSLPAIRGLADDRLRVKVDGMDLIAACPNHMNPALSYIAPQQLEVLDVYAGISPVSQGGDSIGGTIVAESALPRFASSEEGQIQGGQLSVFGQSNNHAQGQSLDAFLATERLNLRYSGNHAQADNYKAGGKFKTSKLSGRPGHLIGLDEVASSAYERESQSLGLGIKLGEDLLDLKVGYQHVPEELFPNQRMDMTGNTQRFINLRYLANFSWGELDTRVYQEKVEHQMQFGPDRQFWYGTAPGMPMASEATTRGITSKATIDLSEDSLLRTGIEYQTYRLDDYWEPSGTGGMSPNTFWNIRDGKRDRAALFAEWEGRLTEQWQALAGLRYERVSSDAGQAQGYNNNAASQKKDLQAFNARNHQRTDDNFDVTLMARYHYSQNLDIELGLAHKVRSPNLYERYTWSSWGMAAGMNNTAGDGNGYVGNLDLKPEAANTASVTFDWHDTQGDHQLRVTPFYTRVNDYIDAVAVPGQVWQPEKFNVLKYKNQSARLYGVDLSGQTLLANTGWGRFGLEGVVNYVDGRNRDTGDSLYNVMPLNTTLALTQRIGGWENAFEMQSAMSKNHVSDVRNEIKTPGYTLYNLRVSHQWQQVRVDLGVENIFDKFYYLPNGGTYVAQLNTMSLKGMPWGTAVPGMGRTYSAGVSLSF